MVRRKSFIKRLLSPKKKSRKKKPSASSGSGKPAGWHYKSNTREMQSVILANIEPLEIPEGDYTLKVFTYDGRPLKGTRKGSRFLLDVVPGARTMVSIYTETEWTSDTAVAYKGLLVGHMQECKVSAHLESLARKYRRVQVHAKRLGTDPGGWPLIEIHAPYTKYGDPTFELIPKDG